MPTVRKKSPTSVLLPEDDDDDSKYHKKRRLRRRKRRAVKRLSWSTFGIFYGIGTVVLLLQVIYDSDIYQHHLKAKERYRRAKILQKHRRADKVRRVYKGQQDDTPLVIGEEPTEELLATFAQLDHDILNNIAGGPRFIRPKLLPSLPGQPENAIMRDIGPNGHSLIGGQDPFRVRRRTADMAWQKEDYTEQQPKVDYTTRTYQYPDISLDGPPPHYPQMTTLEKMLTRWPQNDLDTPPTPIIEQLVHFNYSDPVERQAAVMFRDAKVPFKLYDIPEVTDATLKWTDEYVSKQFDQPRSLFRAGPPKAKGQCQESPNHYFAFYTPQTWHVSTMGVPPVRNNDLTFEQWATHARYADSTRLKEDQPHFYWQAGVDREERLKDKSEWTFVSKDLPSFSSPTKTFFVFEPEQQKGIQCRFGERGVTAATHYDAGRNMIAMVTGAKRYILSPPNQCSRLGIVTPRGHSIFRHSLLNFGNLQYLNQTSNMSKEERAWLERSRDSLAVETVLKAGEVLYIPSHWFHYITSLQKSAQCNVRSGVEKEGTPEWGGAKDVYDCDAE